MDRRQLNYSLVVALGSFALPPWPNGVVGSMGAIEVARTLAENNVTTRHPLEVVIFQNEEAD
jgi:hypothetical protein